MEKLVSLYGNIPAEQRQEAYVFYELGADIPKIKEAINPRKRRRKIPI